MRAFALGEFGAPADGSFQEVPEPEPGEGQVRVRVAAAGVNPADVDAMSGMCKDFMATTFPLVPGWDLAGTIDALGPCVEGLALEDEVFGHVGSWTVGEGSFAEYTVASAGTIARRPERLDTFFAAALPQVGASALQLIEAAEPKPDDVIVVLGATGGIGSVALPLLRSMEVQAIAVARAENHAYARDLGAAETIDYETQDVNEAVRAAHPEGIAGVFDLVGDHSLNGRLDVLIREGGHLLSMRGGADVEALRARGVTGANLATQVTTERLDRLAGLVAEGTLRRPEITTVPLGDAAEALEKIATRHVRGKLVIRVR